jgi:isovaleryl-CoA dehydrogenase
MSEAEAGSDVLGSMRCSARRVDGGWLANGSKMWITNGPQADVAVVYMRTEDAGGPSPITAFVIERGLSGFSAAQHLDKLGMRGSGTCELLFEDCLIPEDHVLGQPGDGVRVLMSGLNTERLVLCGGPIGIMQAALDLVLPRSGTAPGVPIGPSSRWWQTRRHVRRPRIVARSHIGACRRSIANRSRIAREAAAALLHASERAVDVALEVIQALAAGT